MAALHFCKPARRIVCVVPGIPGTVGTVELIFSAMRMLISKMFRLKPVSFSPAPAMRSSTRSSNTGNGNKNMGLYFTAIITNGFKALGIVDANALKKIKRIQKTLVHVIER